jgi:outer membrane protein assembly factor BamE (lipoprotein component of BamABCDE complex)
MHRRHVILLALLVASATASAETLLVDRVHQENAAAMPTRGMTMAQVQARFGAPSERLDPRGGQKRQWPTINRWTYPAFTVYFEKNHVVDAVANKADAEEIGPKPPIK